MWFWDVPARVMRKHSLGKRRFILQVGVLQFGLSWSLMMIAANMSGLMGRPPYEYVSAIAADAAIAIVGGALAGLIFGTLMWRHVCRQKARKEAMRSPD